MKPSLPELLSHLQKEPSITLVPIYVEIPADLLTPVSAYLKLNQGNMDSNYSFLLESVERGSNIGRYSFLGSAPIDVIKVNNQDPLLVLEERLKHVKYLQLAELPSFTGLLFSI